jgi:hypothetical protein
MSTWTHRLCTGMQKSVQNASKLQPLGMKIPYSQIAFAATTKDQKLKPIIKVIPNIIAQDNVIFGYSKADKFNDKMIKTGLFEKFFILSCFHMA